jgi:hypothetical protein
VIVVFFVLMAIIIVLVNNKQHWQAKEINRVILEEEPEVTGIDLSLLVHVILNSWDNVLLDDRYVLNRGLIQP